MKFSNITRAASFDKLKNFYTSFIKNSNLSVF